MENKNAPIIINLEPGTHYLCRCLQSKNMPYCDGSHASTEFTPHVANIVESTKIAICTCSQSVNGIFCDGSHKNITE